MTAANLYRSYFFGFISLEELNVRLAALGLDLVVDDGEPEEIDPSIGPRQPTRREKSLVNS